MALVRVRTLKLAATALLSAVVSCGDGNEVTSAAGPGGGAASPSGGPSPGAGYMIPPNTTDPSKGGTPPAPSGTTPTEKDNCGVTNFNPQRQQPELLLVLDKSGSMNESQTMPVRMVDAPIGMRKWDAIRTSLDGVIKSTQADVYWGLKIFPSDNECSGAGRPLVEPELSAYAPIMMRLNAITRASGGTPTAEVVRSAAAYLAQRKTPNPKYIVLATDGLPTCKLDARGRPNGGNDDGPEAIKAVGEAAMAGVPVFVVGISIDGLDGTLSQMAMAGGRPRNDAKKYYPTSSGDEFTKALSSITSTIASCNYGLGTPIEAQRPIAVNLDGARLTEGKDWSFGAGRTSIELLGDACEKVKSGSAKKVEVLKGCLGQTTPIP